ncbi:MAG: triose-phosphate isomerase, partial [Firmicutes bacterium]|nr:triose-phosphate isomerase [Bacillota bacterium]
SNIADIMSQPDIDGALVGGASLDPEGFADIVRRAAEAKGRRVKGRHGRRTKG